MRYTKEEWEQLMNFVASAAQTNRITFKTRLMNEYIRKTGTHRTEEALLMKVRSTLKKFLEIHSTNYDQKTVERLIEAFPPQVEKDSIEHVAKKSKWTEDKIMNLLDSICTDVHRNTSFRTIEDMCRTYESSRNPNEVCLVASELLSNDIQIKPVYTVDQTAKILYWLTIPVLDSFQKRMADSAIFQLDLHSTIVFYRSPVQKLGTSRCVATSVKLAPAPILMFLSEFEDEPTPLDKLFLMLTMTKHTEEFLLKIFKEVRQKAKEIQEEYEQNYWNSGIPVDKEVIKQIFWMEAPASCVNLTSSLEPSTSATRLSQTPTFSTDCGEATSVNNEETDKENLNL